MSEITKLEPKLVWELFDAITRVPRPSKKEEKIREFLVDFAKKHNIDYQTDETSNVVMRVPGTKGYENRPCVILQSHMDLPAAKVQRLQLALGHVVDLATHIGAMTCCSRASIRVSAKMPA